MATYIALIHKDSDSDFGVSFPDLPGCITAGRSLDEAKDFAAEALAAWVEDAVEAGESLPDPSSLERILEHEDSSDALAVLVVPAPEVRSRTVRINLTVPEHELIAIDQAAQEAGMNRSAFMVRASLKNAHEKA
ncbi:MAG: CopG family transcriptional regulator [Desulfovibrio sp.]|nr:MAG: CopG family transcriptional regulator [Desulfovibrio sp.]